MNDLITNFFHFKAFLMERGMDVSKVTVSPLFVANFEKEVIDRLMISMQTFFETYSGLEYEVDYTDDGISIRYEIKSPF